MPPIVFQARAWRWFNRNTWRTRSAGPVADVTLWIVEYRWNQEQRRLPV